MNKVKLNLIEVKLLNTKNQLYTVHSPDEIINDVLRKIESI